MRISNLKFQILLLCAVVSSRGISSAAALSPSGGDDTAALQSAFAAGGAIALTGTFNLSKTLTPANGASITGGTLLWTGPANTANTYALSFAGTGLTVTNVIFNGAGATFNNASGVKFTNNTVEDIPGGTPTGVNFTGLANSSIASNTFANIAAIGAIFGYNPAGSSFTANRISNVGEGMHILWNNASANCSVSNNDVSAFSRHGIELQGDPQGLAVAGNYVHDPAAAASHIWMSIATGGETTRGDNATGVVIRGNACTAPVGFVANPQVNYCMLEAMGNGTQVIGNYFAGGGWGGLVTDNPNMTWSNNQCHAVAAGVPYTQETPNPAIGSFNAATQAGNTQDNVWTGTLPPAIAAAVGAEPGSATPVLPTAAAPATTAPATQPALTVTLANNKDGSLSATWNDPSKGTIPPTISIAPTGNPALVVSIGTLAAGSTSAKIGNIPNNWVVQLTVSCGSAGSGSATVQVTGGPPPAVPAGGWSPAIVPPAATQPAGKTITHTITVYSDGSVVTN